MSNLSKLEDALKSATIRYTRDHGEPNPSPAIPYEVVLSIKQWNQIQGLLAKLKLNTYFDYIPVGTNTVTSTVDPVLIRYDAPTATL
jgi:hypothetical protein